MANIPRLRAVLMYDATWSAWIKPLAVVYWPYIPNPRGALLLNYKLVTNLIRSVKINVLSYPWYTV